MKAVLAATRGQAWWQSAKHVGFVPAFVADVDAVLAESSVAKAS